MSRTIAGVYRAVTTGCRRIFQEKISAGASNRPEFQRMLDQIRDGELLVVWKLDRLARSNRDLLEAMETIRGAGGKFQSISEPWADTTSHVGHPIGRVSSSWLAGNCAWSDWGRSQKTSAVFLDIGVTPLMVVRLTGFTIGLQGA